MAYFLAFVVSAPAGALMAPRWGWQSVFGILAVLGVAVLILALVEAAGHRTAMSPRFQWFQTFIDTLRSATGWREWLQRS